MLPDPTTMDTTNSTVSNVPDSSGKANSEIVVTEDLSLPSKRSAVYSVIQSMKDELLGVETKLSDLSSTKLSRVELRNDTEELFKQIQKLQSSVGDVVDYLPPYEQRLLQSRLVNARRILDGKRSNLGSDEGFFFRRAAKPTTTAVPQISETLDAANAKIAPVNGHNKPLNLTQKTCGLSNASDEVKKLDRATVKEKDVVLSSLVNCKIVIEGCSSTLHLKDLVGCLIVSGPIRSSVFLTNCRTCTLAVACQQLRIHDSQDLKCYVHLSSGGIIEGTQNAGFAPYNVSYEGIDEDFRDSGLDKEPNNNWQNIQDFDYVVSNKRSPNWHIISEHERNLFSDIL